MIDTKFKKYVFYSQLVFQTIVLTIVGLYIGYRINKGSTIQGLLAVLGFLIGALNFGIMIYRMEKNEKRKRNYLK